MKSKWPDIKKNISRIEAWCRDGMLEKDIATKLGISVSTLEKYKKEHSELSEAIKHARAPADESVENSLYKTCTGYTNQETQAIKCKEVYYDAAGRRCEREHVETIVVDKYYPPNPMSIFYYLNNRAPKKWRRNANKEDLDQKKFEHEKEIDGKKYW